MYSGISKRTAAFSKVLKVNDIFFKKGSLINLVRNQRKQNKEKELC